MLHLYSTASHSFEIKTLIYKKGENTPIKLPHSGISFIMEGEIEIRLSLSENLYLKAEEMFFLPSEMSLNIISLTDTRILNLQIPDTEAFCYHFFQPSVFKKKSDHNKAIFSLPMHKSIKLMTKDLENYIHHGLIHPMLVKIKALEYFYLLSIEYGEDQLAGFFAPILSPDYIFSRFILDNYSSVKTVEELARLSNYSLSGFEKQFRKVFGMAPYKWMIEKKTEKVYYEIYETSKPLKVIAEEAGFAGLSQLSDFCRKRLGASPAIIRGKRKFN